MREIEAPDGTIIEFPDSMSDAEIQAVMKKKYPYEPVDFKATTAIKNIPSSALQLGKDLWTAVTNPLDTLGSIRNLAQGIVEKAIPETINGVDFGETENEQLVNAVGNYLVDRYGGLDEIKTTIMNDPTGFLLDASAILTGGGSLAAKAPGVVGKVASGIQVVGQAVDPLNITASAAKYAAGKVLPDDLPQNMLEEVMKLSTTLDQRYGAGTTAEMVATMLRENVPPTKAGLARLDAKISDLSKKQLQTLVRSGYSQYSNAIKKMMFDKVPTNTRFVYIGPNDGKTRSECRERIEMGTPTKSEVLGSKFGNFDNAVWNCRHSWEEITNDIVGQGFQGEV